MSELIDRTVFTKCAPHVFFRGKYVFRTLNGAMALIALLLTSAVFAVLAVYIPSRRGEILGNAVKAAFILGGIAFGASGIRVLWGWIWNHHVDIEINERGIISGRRFWPWLEVHSLYGTRYGNDVSLSLMLRDRVVLGAGELPTTPLLTERQYLELVRELSRYLSTRFPHVDVAMSPLEPVGS